MSSQLIIITSGRGPEECCYVVGRILDKIINEAKEAKITVDIKEKSQTLIPNNYRSVVLELRGNLLNNFLSQWIGTIRWVEKSPYRKGHKRKNWYVGISKITVPHAEELKLSDIEITYSRASGAGGQGINKGLSAVEIKHVPSGIIVRSQKERKQNMNKKDALLKLKQALIDVDQKNNVEVSFLNWMEHNLLIRGNEIRKFSK